MTEGSKEKEAVEVDHRDSAGVRWREEAMRILEWKGGKDALFLVSSGTELGPHYLAAPAQQWTDDVCTVHAWFRPEQGQRSPLVYYRELRPW